MSPAARISVIYFLIGAAWIITSDSVVQVLTRGSSDAYALAQTFKGWLYVGASAAVLYALLKREFDARRRSEQKVADREADFRTLFANNPLPMFVYDRETLRFLDVNETACAYYRYTHDEFLQLTVAEIRPPEDIPRLMESISSFTGMYKEAGHWIHLTKDGHALDVEVFMLLFEYTGRPAILSVMRDVSEQRRSEAERLENERLRLMLAQEAELNTMRSRFISMVSHEFRRPLTTVTASVELLEHYRARMTDESAQKHFSRIHTQLAEMTELLDDFLTLMRDEVELNDFKPAPVDLIDLCRRLTEEVKLTLPEGLTITCITNCDSVVIEGDEKLLRHAVGNLLSNAVKYSPDGGAIRMEVCHGEMLEIHVSDQGMGIPLADQEHIFDPFFRAENVGELSGTGLGLAIARRAVETHGGTIAIAHSDSSGTEFVISLPVDQKTILTGC